MGASPGASSGKILIGFLVTFQNDPSGSYWPIYGGRITIGRGTAASGLDVPISDASSSARHASVVADGSTGQAFIEDEGSRNGTFLNEERLAAHQKRQLRDSDRLRLGSTTFVVKLLVC